ncbi:MAG TPA: YdcF family protein [Gemmatimonadaceae bacterium]|nr:YdcF family protein [Gemmatimonadaceae bacterium]
MPRRHRWVAARLGVAAVLGAWLLSVLAVVVWGARDRAEPADAIVVLGAAQYAGRPSPVLKARLDHAVALWKQGLARHLIVTGGRGTGDTTTEAAVSRRYLLRQGVADSVILLEDLGRTTNASLDAVADIMRRHGLRRAILVSDPFHMLRLQILAQRLGVQSVTSPTRSSPISASPTKALGYVLSESIKVPVTVVLGMLGREGR